MSNQCNKILSKFNVYFFLVSSHFKLQTEAEGRVRILLHSLDSLEHLTYKLQSLRNLLENLDSVLLVNTPSVNTTTTIGENQLSNKLNTINHPDEIDSCILRIKAALSESNSSHNNVISTLPSVKQKFIASVNRYADSKVSTMLIHK